MNPCAVCGRTFPTLAALGHHVRTVHIGKPARDELRVTGEWSDDAACRGQTDLMFGDPDDSRPSSRVWQAKQLCSVCPVISPCLEHAIRFDEPAGVWGGMTVRERRAEIGRRIRRANVS